MTVLLMLAPDSASLVSLREVPPPPRINLWRVPHSLSHDTVTECLRQTCACGADAGSCASCLLHQS